MIPVLLVREGALVKTVEFGKFRYVGDPINVVRIFNELEVDELVVLDISATKNGTGPDFDLIAQLSLECFMPFAYGGGIHDVEQATQLFKQGVEKVVLNTAALERPDLVRQIADRFGSQAVVVSVDVRRKLLGGYEVFTRSGTRKVAATLDDVIERTERSGAGELLLQSIDRDGTYLGYDVALLRHVTAHAQVPVIACGGAASPTDFASAVASGASAVGAGSLFVFQGKDKGVLVNFPTHDELAGVLDTR